MNGDIRRAFPPARRRPNPMVVLGRWWLEITSGLVMLFIATSAVRLLGGTAAAVAGALTAVGLALAAAQFDPVREGILSAYQRLVVPHRARLGCVQAGVASREGRIPTILRAQCRADQVRLWLMLPAGVVADDLVAARQVIAGSCGATAVVVLHHGPRQDRAVLVIVRPRWGWLGL